MNDEQIEAEYESIKDSQIEQYLKNERILQIMEIRGEKPEPYIF